MNEEKYAHLSKTLLFFPTIHFKVVTFELCLALRLVCDDRKKNPRMLEIMWRNCGRKCGKLSTNQHLRQFCFSLFPFKKATGTKKENNSFVSVIPVLSEVFFFLNRGMLHIVQKLYSSQTFLLVCFIHCWIQKRCWIFNHWKRTKQTYFSNIRT